jgi:hypothetical protein
MFEIGQIYNVFCAEEVRDQVDLAFSVAEDHRWLTGVDHTEESLKLCALL